MKVFKKVILFTLLVLISCKKTMLEEFHKELCFEKMNDDYLQQIERMPDIQMGWGHLLWEGHAYGVSKRDAKKLTYYKKVISFFGSMIVLLVTEIFLRVDSVINLKTKIHIILID